MALTIPLPEQVVLVTGSSKGLGLAILKAFHGVGASVILNYHSTSEEGIRQVLSAHFASSDSSLLRVSAEQGDVRDKAQVQAIFDRAKAKFGRPVTTVVNNAMIGQFAFNGDARPKIEALQWTQMDDQIRGFVQGTLNTTQAAIPHFEEVGAGRIINIGSNLLSHPVVPYHDYVAGKGALLAFTRTSAAELGAKNITCNMVSGGLLRTTAASESTPEAVFEIIQSSTPLKRVTTPEEVADVVLFFASPWARGVTGQDINVDGGLVMT